MITVNGKQVAGAGSDGTSPYQAAVSSGYAGTEATFNAGFEAIGSTRQMLDKINGEVIGSTNIEKSMAAYETKTNLKTAIGTSSDKFSDYPTEISDGKSTVAAAITAKG